MLYNTYTCQNGAVVAFFAYNDLEFNLNTIFRFDEFMFADVLDVLAKPVQLEVVFLVILFSGYEDHDLLLIVGNQPKASHYGVFGLRLFLEVLCLLSHRFQII